jgi:hypothetical protein
VCAAVGVKGKLRDLSTLLNKTCLIGIRISKDKTEQYPDRNEVGRIMALQPPPAFKAVNGGPSDSIPF